MAWKSQATLCGSLVTMLVVLSVAALAQGTPKSFPTGTTSPKPPQHTAPTETNPPITIGGKTIPRPPAAPGCYTYTPNAGPSAWKVAPCLSPAEASRIPHLITGGGVGTLGIGYPAKSFGLQASTLSEQFPDPGNWTVTDSATGKTAFSIQLNTNTFNATCHSSNHLPLGLKANQPSPCVSGDNAWVQFTFQTSNWGKSIDNICIWNVDLTKQYYYDPFTWQNCQQVGKAGFWPANKAISLTGYIDHVAHNVDLIAELPWLTTTYSIVTPDWYGLCWTAGIVGTQCPWNQVSGSIYGLGNGSVANFGPNTFLQTTIQSSVFSGQNNGVTVNAGVTLESNNLTAWYFGNPATSCTAFVCTLTYDSSNIKPGNQ
jgi:hypothetical protein